LNGIASNPEVVCTEGSSKPSSPHATAVPRQDGV
jgi:hypothetical protein